jgi:hypothetical protein
MSAAKHAHLPMKRPKRYEKRKFFPCKEQLLLYRIARLKNKKNSSQTEITESAKNLIVKSGVELNEALNMENVVEILKLLKKRVKITRAIFKKKRIEHAVKERQRNFGRDPQILKRILQNQKKYIALDTVLSEDASELHDTPQEVKE